LPIDRGKARRAFNGILELVIVDQYGDNLDADVDQRDDNGEENRDFEAAGAPFSMPCRM